MSTSNNKTRARPHIATALILNRKLPITRVTIFSLRKRRTFFDNNYYQPYKLFCKAEKFFWTLVGHSPLLIISTNTAVYFLIDDTVAQRQASGRSPASKQCAPYGD